MEANLNFKSSTVNRQYTEPTNDYHTLDIEETPTGVCAEGRRCPPTRERLSEWRGTARDVIALGPFVGAIAAGMGTLPYHATHLGVGLTLLSVSLGAMGFKALENNCALTKVDTTSLLAGAIAYAVTILVTVLDHQATTI